MTYPPTDDDQNQSGYNQVNPVSPPVPPPPPNSYYSQPPVTQQQNESNALIALILGIVSITSCFPVGIVAIILGNKARGKIRESNGTYGGDGMAKAGIILGWIGVALFIAAILFYVLYFVIFFSALRTK